MRSTQDAIVIGGGISGLACAFRLQQLGVPVTLLESSPRVGGLVGTTEHDGFLFDSGPQSFQGTASLLTLVRELGIENELLSANSRAPRYILRHGRLQKVPMSPPRLVLSPFVGVSSRWKVLSEPLSRTKPPAEDESIADFTRRKFGQEILDYLVAPFVSGVYAGDPERLSLRAAFPMLHEWERAHGSVLRGAMKSRSAKSSRTGAPALCSFRRGMATLALALSAKLGNSVKANAQALSITRREAQAGSGYTVGAMIDGAQRTLETRAVVFATPAYTAGELLRPISESLGHLLSGIPYAPVAVVTASYHLQQLARALDGFGVLIPRNEQLRTLGIVWNSSLFPEHAPHGMTVITSFLGGATDREIVSKAENEIAAIAQKEAARVLGTSGPPVAAAVRTHPNGLPQYNLGHSQRADAIRSEERKLPGIYFTGNYLDGPSITNCVEQGFRTAEAVQRHLKSPD